MCSPTIVITANGEVQTHEEATVSVKELEKFDNESPRGYASSLVARKTFAMKTGIPTNGSLVKNHISLKTGFGYLATRRTSFLLLFQACQVRLLDLHQLQRHPSRQESHSSSSSSSSSSSPTVSEIRTRERGDRIDSDISPVHVSTTVDERSGRPDDNQANKKPQNQ